VDDPGIHAAVDVLLAADTADVSRDELGALVGVAQRVRCWLDAVEVGLAQRAGVLAAEGASESAAGVLAHCGRRSTRSARAAADRAEACALVASLAPALAAGRISAAHVDAVARLVSRLDDTGRSWLVAEQASLLAAAVNEPVAMFERSCRDLARLLIDETGEADRQRRQASVRGWIDRRTGMHHLHAELDPERGDLLTTALDTHLATLMARDANAGVPLESLAADALIELVTGSGAIDPRVPEIIVVVDHTTLTTGHQHADTVCETSRGIPLPIDTVRRMCCDAVIVGLTADGLAMGREIRTANRRQRRALRAMYRTCAHPDCDVPFDSCRIHHVIWWEHLGPTNLDNLLPLCSRHHHLVHEQRWQLTMTPDRVITLHRPDGTHHHTGDTRNRGRTPATVHQEPTPPPTPPPRTSSPPTSSPPTTPTPTTPTREPAEVAA
jgi:hypothetical protein